VFTVEDRSEYPFGKSRAEYPFAKYDDAKAFALRVVKRAERDTEALEVLVTVRDGYGRPLVGWNVSLPDDTGIEPLPEPRYNDDV